MMMKSVCVVVGLCDVQLCWRAARTQANKGEFGGKFSLADKLKN